MDFNRPYITRKLHTPAVEYTTRTHHFPGRCYNDVVHERCLAIVPDPAGGCARCVQQDARARERLQTFLAERKGERP